MYDFLFRSGGQKLDALLVAVALAIILSVCVLSTMRHKPVPSPGVTQESSNG